MGLFGRKKANSFLGVDLGASGIKVVEFGFERGKAKLFTYGYAEIPGAEAGDMLLDHPASAGALLAQVVKEAGVKATSAMAALPTSHVFSAILAVPDGKDPRTRQLAVNTEVAKLTPLPITEMVVQTTFLDEEKKPMKKDKKAPEPAAQKPGMMRVLVTGAAKTLVQKYIEAFKAAKVNLQAIDTEALALVRALVGKDKGAILLLDIGGKRTNIIIVEKGIPFVTRSVTIGGNVVTGQIMRQMSVDEAQADRVKRDLGTMGEAAGPVGDGGLPVLLEPLLHPIVNEIRYAMQLYANMELSQIKRIEKIVVTGGSAHLPRVPEYLANVLNVNVYRGDPWARVLYPSDLGGILEEIGPRMSVAVGLAMREMD